MGFSRQEYWSGLPFPSPGYLPDRGIEPGSPALKADTLCNTLYTIQSPKALVKIKSTGPKYRHPDSVMFEWDPEI